MEILFDVGTKGEEGIEDLGLSAHGFLVELAIEHPEQQWENLWEKWPELRIEGLSQRLDERYQRKVQGCVLPEIRDQREDVGHKIADVLLDDAN